jgi:hypothetical protein
MCVDCVLASSRIAQANPSQRTPPQGGTSIVDNGIKRLGGVSSSLNLISSTTAHSSCQAYIISLEKVLLKDNLSSPFTQISDKFFVFLLHMLYRSQNCTARGQYQTMYPPKNIFVCHPLLPTCSHV